MIDSGQPRALFLEGNRQLFDGLVDRLSLPVIKHEQRRFPDGESYVRIDSDVTGEEVLIYCSLDCPDPKILRLVFTAETLKEQDADSIYLMAPYLAYMRQDKIFEPGEGVTSRYFARLIDRYFDGVMTVDPHLHRYDTLDELYSSTTHVYQAAYSIGTWIKDNISDPILIGPDSESKQWINTIAENTDFPCTVLQKDRHGDRDVTIKFESELDEYHRQPVLVDDIISTGGTMIRATKMLQKKNCKPPICIGVHAIFADDAYRELSEAGVKSIVTCNTIEHPSNGINLTNTLINQMETTYR